MISRTLMLILVFCISFLFATVGEPLLGIYEVSPFFMGTIALVLYLGLQKQSVGLAIALGFLGEFFSGSHFGVLVLPLLVSIGGLFFLGRLLDIKPLMEREYWTFPNIVMLIVVGIIMLLIMLVMSVLVARGIYGDVIPLSSVAPLFLNWKLYLYNALFLATIFGCVRLVYRGNQRIEV